MTNNERDREAKKSCNQTTRKTNIQTLDKMMDKQDKERKLQYATKNIL